MDDNKKEWFKSAINKSKLFTTHIIPMNPQIGRYITVEKMEIPANYFHEEFEQITNAYFSVLKKIEEFDKNLKK